MRCEEIPLLMEELEQLQAQIVDAKIRVSKIMNVISKEYDGQWDRYLYDKDLAPEEDTSSTGRRKKLK